MTEYKDLSKRAKLRRLGLLAQKALTYYDIDVKSCKFHKFATNLIYRVDTHEGEKYILRLAYPGWREPENLLAEALWLEALNADTDITAPRIIKTKTGQYVIPMQDFGIPNIWHTSLMTWLDGRLMAHYLTEKNLEKMGQLFAKLHIHGKSWQPPKDFSSKKFGAFLSRGEENALFSENILNMVTESDKATLQKARHWVEQEYASLDKSDIRVIHCDLWHENVKLHNGNLCPFDFEDTIWGYRLHDMAMGLLDLQETVGNQRYAVLLSSFRMGYEKLLDWPKGNLEVLQIGRMLWKQNYTARFAPEYINKVVPKNTKIFREYEKSGKLLL